MFVTALHETTHSACPVFEAVTADSEEEVDEPGEGPKVLTPEEGAAFQACEEAAADVKAFKEGCETVGDLAACLDALEESEEGDPLGVPECEDFLSTHPELLPDDGSSPTADDLKEFGKGVCKEMDRLRENYSSDEQKQAVADCACNVSPQMPGGEGFNDVAGAGCQLPLPEGGCGSPLTDSYPMAACGACSGFGGS